MNALAMLLAKNWKGMVVAAALATAGLAAHSWLNGVKETAASKATAAAREHQWQGAANQAAVRNSDALLLSQQTLEKTKNEYVRNLAKLRANAGAAYAAHYGAVRCTDGNRADGIGLRLPDAATVYFGGAGQADSAGLRDATESAGVGAEGTCLPSRKALDDIVLAAKMIRGCQQYVRGNKIPVEGE